jgi:hypothetical protein
MAAKSREGWSMVFLLFAAEPPIPDCLGDTLKIVQICFYVLGMILGILTYRTAVKGWLTPTNTEYQKRVMDRLAKLSEDLYAEFDPTTDHYWPKIRAVQAAIENMNETFENHREEALAAKEWYFGTPIAADVQRLDRLLRPTISDPFIPENIRETVVDLLENRLHVLRGIYVREFERYANDLATGKHEPLIDPEDLDDINKIHNRCVEQMRKQGCGITDIENSVHDIRGLIQDYFDSFNPHGVGKGQRRRFEQPPDEQR